MKHFTFLWLFVAGLVLSSSATVPYYVTDIISDSEDHEILESLIMDAGLYDALQEYAPYTVFAPTDDAFMDLLDELGLESLDDLSMDVVTSVLQMHVLVGRVRAADITEGLMKTSLYGENLKFSLEGGVKVMDPNMRSANVTAPDLVALNGVVHVIDKILLTDQRPETVVNIATSSDDFGLLVQALTRTGLMTNFVEVLSGPGPFTVFAPDNDAFADLLAELGLGSLEDVPIATLEAVLKMHVLTDLVVAEDLEEDLVKATFLGEYIKFSLEGGAKIMDPNDRMIEITAPNNYAQNGVVHVINRVILPDLRPASVVNIATSDNRFSLLVQALTRTGLMTNFVEVLSGAGPFTVFAPTNTAFADLLSELGLGALEDVPVATLEAVLKMHVLPQRVMAGDLEEGLMAATVNGEDIKFSLEGGAKIMDKNYRMIDIIEANLDAQNGVVHVINKVILPDLRPATVVNIATSSDDFSLLVQALTRTGLMTNFVEVLSGPGPFTVFAPTNEAFAALLTELGLGALEDVPVATLEAVLKMHVLPQRVMAEDLEEGLMAATVNGEDIKISLEGGPMITDKNYRMIEIIEANIDAQNGVVHVINKVILPDLRPETVVSIATSDDQFSILVQALTRTDLEFDFVSTLSGSIPFTVFAPTNDAFAALLDELGVESLADIDAATLEAVLRMHVVTGVVSSGDLSEGLMATTINGEDIKFSLEGGAKIMDPNDRMIGITGPDNYAQNGVVHVVNKVILPDLTPATVVDIATSDDQFSILVQALTRPDLTTNFVAALSAPGPLTVFAPTNAAFVALLEELGLESLADVPVATLEAVLKMHVVPGLVAAEDLKEGMMEATLYGEDIKFSLEGGAKIMDPNDRSINITGPNNFAGNGVVHVIDRVILPKLVTSADQFAELNTKVYPNPATDFINIETLEGGVLRMYNVTGKLIRQTNLATSRERIDVQGMEAGVYVISIEEAGNVSNRKIILR